MRTLDQKLPPKVLPSVMKNMSIPLTGAFESRNRTKSPDKSTILTENAYSCNGMTAANTTACMNSEKD